MGFFMGERKMKVRLKVSVAIALLALLSTASAADSRPTSPVPSEMLSVLSEPEFGVAFPYQETRANVKLTNLSNKTVTIDAIRPRLATDKFLGTTPIEIAPNGSVEFEVAIQTDHGVGRIAKYFDVYTGNLDTPEMSFAVRGFVDWVVDPESVKVDFGNIDEINGATRTLTIKRVPGSNLKLTGVVDDGDRFKTEVVDDGLGIHLVSKKNAPLGLFDEYVILSTSSTLQPKVGLRVRGQMVTRLVPSMNPVDFALMRTGESSERIVRLEEIDGKPIKIGSVRVEGIEAQATLQDCIPKNDSCMNLRIGFPAQSERGQRGGKVVLELLPSKREFPIEFGALIIGKDTQIRNLDDDLRASAEAEPQVSDVIRNAIRKPPQPLEMPAPEGKGPLLTWQASNEYGVWGYEIFRGSSKDGPFKRVSHDFIKRLDSSGEIGSIYRWRDMDAESGTTYYYYVGLVYEDGRKREFTTPQAVKAK
ncbi:hypothetical protein [Dokdonella sp.]|uniref:hypothetical protein n=1 Tax=Dokdonella sp. TaxID=2291710 RepID=UPI003527F4E6